MLTKADIATAMARISGRSTGAIQIPTPPSRQIYRFQSGAVGVEICFPTRDLALPLETFAQRHINAAASMLNVRAHCHGL